MVTQTLLQEHWVFVGILWPFFYCVRNY